MQRRRFLQLSAASMTAASLPLSLDAREPFDRNGPPRFHVGLAAYSLRKYFAYSRGKTQTPASDGKALDMVGFIDYCKNQGFDAAELTSYFFRPDADSQYFRDLKHAAYVRGVILSGTAIGNNFTVGKGPRLEAEIESAMQWIDRASLLGVPHIRFFAGTGRQLAESPARMDEACDALKRCAEHAADKGIFLGVENHGQLTAEQMLEIMDRVDSPWVGINLDTGNFVSEDPYRDLEMCAGYAVNVQVKVAMKMPEQKHVPADFNRIASILKGANYQGYVVLEYEEDAPYENIPAAQERLRAALQAQA